MCSVERLRRCVPKGALPSSTTVSPSRDIVSKLADPWLLLANVASWQRILGLSRTSTTRFSVTFGDHGGGWHEGTTPRSTPTATPVPS